MILSHSKKFIFFRVAKTGSTTAEVMLRLSNAFDPSQDTLTGTRELVFPTLNRIPQRYPDPGGLFNWAHARPFDLLNLGVLTLEQLREYDCYAFVRPSEGRFVSGYMHCMRSNSPGWSRHGYRPEHFMKRWRSHHDQFSAYEIIGRKQVDWFFVDGEQLVTPLDFANFDAELRRLLKIVGGHEFNEIPKLNRAWQERLSVERKEGWAKAIWDEEGEVRREVHEHYADDIEFYEENFSDSHGNRHHARLHQCG